MRLLVGGLLVPMLLALLAGCSHTGPLHGSVPSRQDARAQLSVGYTLLYQEADGIPKLKWLLLFKDKSADMAELTADLTDYYRHLADTLQRLSREFPAVRLDVTAMSPIESETRKAMGEDLARDMAPVVGRSGKDFEREALLMFHDALDEQRHLVGVMIGLETDPALKKFLESTRTALDERYDRTGALLNRRYFSH